jgi:hypothetical protein
MFTLGYKMYRSRFDVLLLADIAAFSTTNGKKTRMRVLVIHLDFANASIAYTITAFRCVGRRGCCWHNSLRWVRSAPDE